MHDLETVRQGLPPKRDVNILDNFDAIVVHGAPMSEWLRRELRRDIPMVELGAFDYLAINTEPPSQHTNRPLRLYVVGNLAYHKIAWMNELDNPAVPIIAYGPNYDSTAFDGRVEWAGQLEINSPRVPMIDGFGLVWDGDSSTTLTHPVGSYLRYNAPHKVSFYLTAGLPVIVPEDSAIAPFVKQYQIGLVASSVAEAAKAVASVTSEQWLDMLGRVNQVRARLINGRSTLEAVTAAVALGRQNRERW